MKPLQAALRVLGDGRVELLSPGVGHWMGAPALSQWVSPGQRIGSLDVLGRRHELVAPPGALGAIVERPGYAGTSSSPVAYDGVLLRLQPGGAATEALVAPSAGNTVSHRGLVFTSPSSGRYYSRPSPDKPAFVEVGDEIQSGQVVFLLEVMKTFSRVSYGDAGLPERARVTRILPRDGDDIDVGAIVLELESI